MRKTRAAQEKTSVKALMIEWRKSCCIVKAAPDDALRRIKAHFIIEQARREACAAIEVPSALGMDSEACGTFWQRGKHSVPRMR